MKQEDLQRSARRELSALNIVGIPDVSAVRKAKDKLEEKAQELPIPAKKPAVVKNTIAENTIVKNTIADSTIVKNTTVEILPEGKVDIRSNFHKFDNDVSDILAKIQTPMEQVIYHRLYRLSYGFGKNTCQVGMGTLARACNVSSSGKTIKRAIDGLVEKGHIGILKEHGNNSKGTKYRIFLPCEVPDIESSTVVENTIVENTTADSKPLTEGDDATVVKNTIVENTVVDPTVVESTVVFEKDAVVENTIVENTTASVDPLLTGDDRAVVKNTVVNLTPNIDKKIFKYNNSLSPDIYIILITLIADFYEQLGQSKISREKRERAEKNIQELLDDGFSPEDIQFAAQWTLENAKEKPYDFSIIKHTISQAMAEKEKIEKAKARKAKKEKAEKQRKAEEEKQKAEEERIKEHKESLSKRERTRLRKKAEAEIRDSGQFKEEFITEHLIEAKENEILTRKLADEAKEG